MGGAIPLLSDPNNQQDLQLIRKSHTVNFHTFSPIQIILPAIVTP